jgi:hypothetical protein
VASLPTWFCLTNDNPNEVYMTSIICNAPFCRESIKYAKSKFCSPHQIERQKLGITAYKELLPLWSLKRCKIHGYLRPSQCFKRLNKNQYICKQCQKTHRQPDFRPSEKTKTLRKHNNLIKRYGITQKEYDSILLSQNNVCAICKSTILNFDSGTGVLRRMCVDHCHVTKKVRGILCFNCNVGLGNFQDNPLFLVNALEYLRHHK